MEGTFFGDSWIGKEVEFSNPEVSKWRIKEKTCEKHLLFTPLDLKTRAGPKMSYSQAVFVCEKIDKDVNGGGGGEERKKNAFLKVYRQIPHVGTIGDPHSTRAQQGGTRSFCDITAYKHFARQQAKHLPICLAEKYERQDDYDLVPGGFMYYVVYTKPPGLHLDKDTFWSLERNERDAIRGAFVDAYNEMRSLRHGGLSGLHNLVWDRQTCAIYIVDFTMTYEMSPKSEWNDFIFASWGLATPPAGTKGPKHGVAVPDTSNWKF